MYQVGDLVLYGTTGVCRVTDVSMATLPGLPGEQLYYTLSPLYQQCVIQTPAENGKVFMRPIITREEAERLIALIPTIQAEPRYGKANTELVEHYASAIRTHDCEDLVELTMSIYAKKLELEEQKKKFGAVDERFMRQAEDLLFGELAAALGIQRDEVPAYIAAKVDAPGKG